MCKKSLLKSLSSIPIEYKVLRFARQQNLFVLLRNLLALRFEIQNQEDRSIVLIYFDDVFNDDVSDCQRGAFTRPRFCRERGVLV